MSYSFIKDQSYQHCDIQWNCITILSISSWPGWPNNLDINWTQFDTDVTWINKTEAHANSWPFDVYSHCTIDQYLLLLYYQVHLNDPDVRKVNTPVNLPFGTVTLNSSNNLDWVVNIPTNTTQPITLTYSVEDKLYKDYPILHTL